MKEYLVVFQNGSSMRYTASDDNKAYGIAVTEALRQGTHITVKPKRSR